MAALGKRFYEFSHLGVKILIKQCISLLDCYCILYSIDIETHHHLAALNKSGSHLAPWGPIPNFLRAIDSSMYLQTFLLNDFL